MIGYIKLYRQIIDSDIFQNEKALKIWLWILLKAKHEKGDILLGREKISLNQGEFVMGLNKASDQLNLAKSTIHYWLQFLEEQGMVELKKTNKYTIIKVKNWNDFQGVELKKNSKRTLKETNNNDKECLKNDKEIKSRAFAPPSFEEVKEYCLERNNEINPQSFIDFYSSKGWMVGKNKMKDWRASVRTWETRNKTSSDGNQDLNKLTRQKYGLE